ncbi:MAG TPA: hypothetical protein VGH73_01025 [Thermoanaerobaculia bacterium]|jgi:hypothetical protein
MEYPPESLKSFCNRVAEAAVSEDGTRLARLLRLTGLLGEPFRPVAGAAESTPTPAPTPGRVGIWESKSEGGQTYFARRLDMLRDWNLWANLGRIEPKRGRRRVVLIGESVARGYLYDPQFTPAMALETILAGQLGKGQVEVIDLARTNLGIEVGELALSTLQLEPDAVVIFSGNNWSVSFPPQISEVAHIDAGLREEGMASMKRFAEEQLVGNVRRMVRDVSSVYRQKNVPLVWMVPEFNLGDWRDPVTNAPYLPGTANLEWIERWRQARQALDARDLERAAELARRMVELDQGVSIAGLYILAECSQRSGDIAATRRYLELARDAVIWDPSRSTSPRTYAVAQEALRGEAAEHGATVVDMPQIFHEYLGGGIPDRRLFLDYCHLTTEGIQVSMAAAASPVLRALKRVEVPWRDLVDEKIAPSREVEAEAAFLAAVHNAHWWQSYDLVRHYCSSSVQASPAIAEVMTRFIDIQTRQTPMLMCRASEEIAGLGSPLIQHYLLRYNHQQLDRLLIDAVSSALQEIGVDTRETLARLRREEHSVTRSDTNLLAYYYGSAGLQPQEVMWVVPGRDGHVRRKENHFYKAYWLESRFVFAGEAGCPVRLSLTCRLPGPAPAQGTLALDLNGRPQAEIGVGREWETWDLAIPGDTVQEGLNEIVIHWPLPEFPGRQALETVADDLIDGAFPEFFCSFGEIHTFVVADARKVETFSPAAQASSTTVAGVQ